MEKTSSHTPIIASLPNTYYHSVTNRPIIDNDIIITDEKFDFLIIGAGFTGLGAALRLSSESSNICVLEANEIGAGASGRNGGLVCSGFRHDQKWFEAKLGKDYAKEIWQISEYAKIHLDDILEKHKIEADYEKGLLFAAHKKSMLPWLQEDMEHLSQNYDYNNLKFLDKDQTNEALGTNAYYGGVLDEGAGRINPLKLLYGMASACIKNQVHIYENTRAVSINGNVVTTAKGQKIKADKILICGDAYIEGISQKLDAKVLPIGNFVIATEPLRDLAIMKGAVGAMDTRFVVNYFHKTIDNRLVFGGGEKYSANWPEDISSFVKKNLIKIFPSLSNVKIDYAWGGAVGITPTRLPFIRQLSKNVFTSAGYSGQGVLLSPYFGDILGQMLLGDAKYFEILEKLPVPDFPGGRNFRFPMLSAALSYYSILDKLP